MLSTVDSHHKVLKAWASYRARLNKAPRLITFDHHTDTSPPFRTFIKKNYSNNQNDQIFENLQSQLLNQIDFKVPETVHQAIEKLNNDEHIVAAIKTDIISSAFVIAHNAADTGLDVYEKHKIACRTVHSHDSILESTEISQNLAEFNRILKVNGACPLEAEPYILDIDLDCFNTFESIEPKDSLAFEKLIKNAGLITVATEPEYVKACALDKGLSSDFLLSTLTENFFKGL